MVSPETQRVVSSLARSLRELIDPGFYFMDLLGLVRQPLERGAIGRAAPRVPAFMTDVVLWALVGGLWLAGGARRWAAGLARMELTLPSAAIDPGSQRHEALLLLLVLAARLANPRLAHRAVQAGLHCVSVVQCLTGGKAVLEDVRRARDDGSDGELATHTARPGQRAGGRCIGFLHGRAAVPLGYLRVATGTSGDERPGMRDRFAWSPAEWKAWQQATVLRATCAGATNENGLLYTLRPAAATP